MNDDVQSVSTQLIEPSINSSNDSQNSKILSQKIFSLEKQISVKSAKTTFFYAFLAIGLTLSIIGTVFFTIGGVSTPNFPWSGPLGWKIYYVYAQSVFNGYAIYLVSTKKVSSLNQFLEFTKWNLVLGIFILVTILFMFLEERGFNISSLSQIMRSFGTATVIELPLYLLYLIIIYIFGLSMLDVVKQKLKLERKLAIVMHQQIQSV